MIFAIGFGQALTGLDVADEKRDSTRAVINTLIQAVLGCVHLLSREYQGSPTRFGAWLTPQNCSSPNFDYYDELESAYPFGLILYYAWSVATIVILLNVLVALFSSACECPPFLPTTVIPCSSSGHL